MRIVKLNGSLKSQLKTINNTANDVFLVGLCLSQSRNGSGSHPELDETTLLTPPLSIPFHTGTLRGLVNVSLSARCLLKYIASLITRSDGVLWFYRSSVTALDVAVHIKVISQSRVLALLSSSRYIIFSLRIFNDLYIINQEVIKKVLVFIALFLNSLFLLSRL